VRARGQRGAKLSAIDAGWGLSGTYPVEYNGIKENVSIEGAPTHVWDGSLLGTPGPLSSTIWDPST
jgi:hypothetical protein